MESFGKDFYDFYDTRAIRIVGIVKKKRERAPGMFNDQEWRRKGRTIIGQGCTKSTSKNRTMGY